MNAKFFVKSMMIISLLFVLVFKTNLKEVEAQYLPIIDPRISIADFLEVEYTDCLFNCIDQHPIPEVTAAEGTWVYICQVNYRQLVYERLANCISECNDELVDDTEILLDISLQNNLEKMEESMNILSGTVKVLQELLMDIISKM